MSQGTITTRKDYDVGLTLDVSLNPCASPFSDESLIAFGEAFKEKNQKNPNAQGEYKFFTTLAQDQTAKSKALDVAGKLGFSYGPVSGDAYVKFAMANIQGSLDSTMIVRATQDGRVVKNSLHQVVALKLRGTVLKQINSGALTFEQFKREYGEYLIIGFEYGGHVLFQSTYSAKSSEDKLSVAGGLSVSYGKLGFNISGSVEGHYKYKDIQKCTNIKTEYTIAPSFNDRLINGNNGIIPLLKRISNPTQNGIDLDGADADKFGNLAEDVDKKIQQLLSSKQLDAINCIVLKIKTIGCVKDAFIEQIQNVKDIQIFFKFANALYMALKEMLKGLESVNDNYDKLNVNGNYKPTTAIDSWFRGLDKSIKLMETIHTTRIYKYAKLYIDTLDDGGDEKEAKELREIEKPFYNMNQRLLQSQFRSEILKPYNDTIANSHNAPRKPCGSYPYIWKWKQDNGKWESYNEETQLLLNKLSVGTDLHITAGKWNYVVTKTSHDACTQRNRQTGTSRVVRRKSRNNDTGYDDNSSEYIFLWQFVDHNNKWGDVSGNVAVTLNALTVNDTTRYDVGSHTYSVKKDSMDKCTQTNNNTGSERKLRRILFDKSAKQRIVWEFMGDNGGWSVADSTGFMEQLSKLSIGSQMKHSRAQWFYVITKDNATHATQKNTKTGKTRKFRMVNRNKDI